MSYTPIFEKPYPTGYKDKPNKTTPITASTLNDKDEALEHIEDYLSNNEFSQLEELPEASEENFGKIYQYIGETDEYFTQGYFYKCVLNEDDYIWENIQVQQGGGGGDTNSWVGTLAEYNSQKDEIPDGTFVGITDDPTGGGGSPIGASAVTFDNTGTEMESTNVQDAIEEVFQSVSNGKELLADAITDKGVETSATDTFETMADNIEQISGGGVPEILDSVSVMNTSTNNNRTYNINRDGYINICGYFFNTNGSVYGNVEMFLNDTLISNLDTQKWLYLQGETVFKLENYQVHSGDIITFRINNSSSGTSNIRALYYLLTLS